MKVLILGKHKHKKEVVEMLISLGYGIYDISTLPNKFSFDQIDEDYKNWNTSQYIEALHDEKAKEAFNIHKEVCEYCVSCLLMLPATDSELFLAGFIKGKGKKVFAYNNDPVVLDVNHLFLSKILSSLEDVKKLFKKKEEYSLSNLQNSESDDKKKKKTKKKGAITKENAKEFHLAYKAAYKGGKRDFKFEGNKINVRESKRLIEYLTNQGWI